MKNLRELLTTMDDPRRDALVRIFDHHRTLFHYAKGSSTD